MEEKPWNIYQLGGGPLHERYGRAAQRKAQIRRYVGIGLVAAAAAGGIYAFSSADRPAVEEAGAVRHTTIDDTIK